MSRNADDLVLRQQPAAGRCSRVDEFAALPFLTRGTGKPGSGENGSNPSIGVPRAVSPQWARLGARGGWLRSHGDVKVWLVVILIPWFHSDCNAAIRPKLDERCDVEVTRPTPDLACCAGSPCY